MVARRAAPREPVPSGACGSSAFRSPRRLRRCPGWSSSSSRALSTTSCCARSPPMIAVCQASVVDRRLPDPPANDRRPGHRGTRSRVAVRAGAADRTALRRRTRTGSCDRSQRCGIGSRTTFQRAGRGFARRRKQIRWDFFWRGEGNPLRHHPDFDDVRAASRWLRPWPCSWGTAGAGSSPAVTCFTSRC